ncbi:anaerobic sulfatase maturase [Planctomycetota bacterium]
MQPNFSLLIKPTSSDCNLGCDYCFYLDKKALYTASTIHRMSEEVLEEVVKKFMTVPQPVYNFGWQGGEPTLMGVDFFRKVVELQQKYNKNGGEVSNSLQTNATLITEEYAQFFKEHNFLLGCSLDGHAGLHDRYRKTTSGKPTHALVQDGITLLQNYRVEFNVLVLVNKANVTEAKDVYHYLVECGYYSQQYIPCVEFGSNGELESYAIKGQEWGTFLSSIFDEWYGCGLEQVSIRNFDAILKMLLIGECDLCTMGESCEHYLVVEHNGDVYPCDFFVSDDSKLGNINDTSWEELRNLQAYTEFVCEKSNVNSECNDCLYFLLCRGDCPKHRKNIDGLGNMSYLCSGWKEFYSRTLGRFVDIARKIQERRL